MIEEGGSATNGALEGPPKGGEKRRGNVFSQFVQHFFSFRSTPVLDAFAPSLARASRRGSFAPRVRNRRDEPQGGLVRRGGRLLRRVRGGGGGGGGLGRWVRGVRHGIAREAEEGILGGGEAARGFRGEEAARTRAFGREARERDGGEDERGPVGEGRPTTRAPGLGVPRPGRAPPVSPPRPPRAAPRAPSPSTPLPPTTSSSRSAGTTARGAPTAPPPPTPTSRPGRRARRAR